MFKCNIKIPLSECKEGETNSTVKIWKSDPLLNGFKKHVNSEPYEFKISVDGIYHIYGQVLFYIQGKSQSKFYLTKFSDKKSKYLVSCVVEDDNRQKGRERVCFTGTVVKLKKGDIVKMIVPCNIFLADTEEAWSFWGIYMLSVDH